MTLGGLPQFQMKNCRSPGGFVGKKKKKKLMASISVWL